MRDFPQGPSGALPRNRVRARKFVVANFDEGDPGAYIDRFIAEDDPFCLIEGMAIAARAVGASRGWIYARCEYPEAIRSLQRAIDDARAAGMLGATRVWAKRLRSTSSWLSAAAVIECGEETSLLNSIEGKRPVARVRPPYVAEHGLWGRPTVVNNVETLANVPWILRNGAQQFASLGIPGSRGTKVVSLNSLFRRPGLYEVEFGVPVREIVEDRRRRSAKRRAAGIDDRRAAGRRRAARLCSIHDSGFKSCGPSAPASATAESSPSTSTRRFPN